MNAMKKLTALHRNVLISCADDFTGLWEVIKDVEQAHTNLGTNEKKQRTLQILKDLLEENLIRAGVTKGKDLAPWNLSAAETLNRISVEWDELDRDPNIGDIVWFQATPEGERRLHEGKEPNVYEE